MEPTLSAFEAQVDRQRLSLELQSWEPVVRFQHLLRCEELDDVRLYRIQASR